MKNRRFEVAKTRKKRHHGIPGSCINTECPRTLQTFDRPIVQYDDVWKIQNRPTNKFNGPIRLPSRIDELRNWGTLGRLLTRMALYAREHTCTFLVG
jgi:hypothetical protein